MRPWQFPSSLAAGAALPSAALPVQGQLWLHRAGQPQGLGHTGVPGSVPSCCPLCMPGNSSPVCWVGVKGVDTEVMGGSGKVRENIWREHLEIQLLCSCQPCTELKSQFSNLFEEEKMSSKLVQKLCRNKPCCQ